MKMIANHRYAQILNTSKDIVCLKEVTHDFSSQPPVISLPCFSIQGVVGKYLFRVEFPPGQTLDFKGWLGNTISNQFFNLTLDDVPAIY
jgi:hypothetical protein